MDKSTIKYPAAAFDLDGTLYPNASFYVRLLPFMLKEQKYLRAFGKARKRLRDESRKEKCRNAEEFYRLQAEYMADTLKQDPASLMERTEKIIYRGWEPLFKKVRLFPHVKETLKALREKGVKLALLSDFPLENKIENLGISGLWDVVLCSETIGELKPDPLPFGELSRVMGFPPEDILYVGNSFSYDVIGAQKAGMNTAWIVSKRKYLHLNKSKNKQQAPAAPKADFVFYDYRQLYTFMIP